MWTTHFSLLSNLLSLYPPFVTLLYNEINYTGSKTQVVDLLAIKRIDHFSRAVFEVTWWRASLIFRAWARGTERMTRPDNNTRVTSVNMINVSEKLVELKRNNVTWNTHGSEWQHLSESPHLSKYVRLVFFCPRLVFFVIDTPLFDGVVVNILGSLGLPGFGIDVNCK